MLWWEVRLNLFKLETRKRSFPANSSRASVYSCAATLSLPIFLSLSPPRSPPPRLEMDPGGPFPRVNSEVMKQMIGRRVVLVCEVESIIDGRATVIAADKVDYCTACACPHTPHCTDSLPPLLPHYCQKRVSVITIPALCCPTNRSESP